MKKASEYRQHAAECRTLAQKMDLGEHREQLLRMAETWDKLAQDREEAARLRSEPAAEPESTPE